jgi:ribosomal protein S18 acetylase RimI-like enzyme
VEIELDRGPTIDEVRPLFVEYAQSLGFSLDFQDFDRELAELPGKYAPPGGALVVARVDGAAAGCVGVRPLAVGICELKRLYVRGGYRRLGLGRMLVVDALDVARSRGYRRLRLDTVPGMEAAQALYAQLGFVEIEPYAPNPVPGTRFLELALG